MIYSELALQIANTAREVEKLIKSLPEEDQSEEVINIMKKLQNSSDTVIAKEQEVAAELAKVLAEDEVIEATKE